MRVDEFFGSGNEEQIDKDANSFGQTFTPNSNSFEIDSFDFWIEKERDFLRYERVKKCWLPRYQLNVIYPPLKYFLTHLQVKEQCGWKIKIWGGCAGKIRVRITVLIINPEIAEVSYSNQWGEKITALRHWHDCGGW